MKGESPKHPGTTGPLVRAAKVARPRKDLQDPIEAIVMAAYRKHGRSRDAREAMGFCFEAEHNKSEGRLLP